MKLYFQELGQGPAMIILHGLFGSSDNWITIAKKLGSDFKVYLPDLRNHGRSPHSDRFDIEAMAHDIEAMIKDEEMGNPILVGHSLGGKVAMKLALTHETIEKLIVVDVSPKKRDHSDQEFFAGLIEAMDSMNLTEIKSRNRADRMLSKDVPDTRIRQFLLKNLFRTEENTYDWRLNLKGLKDNLKNIVEGVQPSGTFQKPTLFIRGENSKYILAEDEASIRELFPASSIATIADAGHWVHAEAPEAVYLEILQFLRV